MLLCDCGTFQSLLLSLLLLLLLSLSLSLSLSLLSSEILLVFLTSLWSFLFSFLEDVDFFTIFMSCLFCFFRSLICSATVLYSFFQELVASARSLAPPLSFAFILAASSHWLVEWDGAYAAAVRHSSLLAKFAVPCGSLRSCPRRLGLCVPSLLVSLVRAGVVITGAISCSTFGGSHGLLGRSDLFLYLPLADVSLLNIVQSRVELPLLES